MRADQTPLARSFVKGALILGIAGFIGKFLGAIYRIPLTNIVGAEGMGLYQMVFPLYALLLTVSSSGLPAAISRLLAEKNALGDRRGARRVFGTAIITLAAFGAVLALLTALLAKPIAAAQGNPNAALAYSAISPSLFFVAVICALRGYFQGKQNMAPTAVSQVVEQAVKMAAGLALAYYLLPRGLEWAIFGALAGVSLSEFAAMLMLIVRYFLEKNRLKPLIFSKGFGESFKTLYSLSIPVTLGALIMPAVQLIDSVMVINILTASGSTVPAATALYGIATGPVNSLINMPVVLSLAIAAAVIPGISAARVKAESGKINKSAALALKLTMLISVPCAIGLAVLAAPIINLLYSGGLARGVVDEPRIAAELLAMLSVSVLLIAFIQVITSILQAMARSYRPVINLAIGAAVKVAASFILLPRIGIYGSAVSTILCFLTVFILNIFSLKKTLSLKLGFRDFFFAPIAAGALMGVAAYLSNALLSRVLHVKIAAVLAILIAGAVFFVVAWLLGAITAEEGKRIPLVKKFYKAK